MEEVGTEHGVLPDCYNERKDWRREIQCVPVFNWRARDRDILSTIEWGKKINAQGNQTEKVALQWRSYQKIWRILPAKEEFSVGKKKIFLEESAWWQNIWSIHDRTKESSINM